MSACRSSFASFQSWQDTSRPQHLRADASASEVRASWAACTGCMQTPPAEAYAAASQAARPQANMCPAPPSAPVKQLQRHLALLCIESGLVELPGQVQLVGHGGQRHTRVVHHARVHWLVACGSRKPSGGLNLLQRSAVQAGGSRQPVHAAHCLTARHQVSSPPSSALTHPCQSPRHPAAG